MTKPVILTGVRANNQPTLGNYFGGIKPIVDIANHQADSYQVNLFIPDLHSFTTPVDHSQLYQQIMNTARVYAAAGLPLDIASVHLYRQSFIPAHSELTWILSCFTGFGEMSRMTQFKDKAGALNTSADSRTSLGLFSYPVLMAADILLYGAKYVPVGDDQTQHLEFTRDIALRFNNRFGEILTPPEDVAGQLKFFGSKERLRIMDLVDPTKKMSKSADSERGTVLLADSPKMAAKKVMSATTDDKASVNFNPGEQPGISNLLEILSLLRGEPLEKTAGQFSGESRYGDFKKIVADEVSAFLEDFQTKLESVSSIQVEKKLLASEGLLSRQANATLGEVQRAIGLRPKRAP